MDKHSEIELKFDGSGVDIHEFLAWAMKELPDKYVRVRCPDVYYTQGDNVVRHRHSGGAGELTVKQLKSADSTTDRKEIDLKFDSSMSVEDVHAFLYASGWKESLVLHKDAHVFWYDVNGICPTTLSIYTTVDATFDNRHTFIEIEAEKEGECSIKTALATVHNWGSELMYKFYLGPAMNTSLYEVYTGKKYKIC